MWAEDEGGVRTVEMEVGLLDAIDLNQVCQKELSEILHVKSIIQNGQKEMSEILHVESNSNGQKVVLNIKKQNRGERPKAFIFE